MVVCSLVSIVSKKAVRDVARRLDLKVGAAGSTTNTGTHYRQDAATFNKQIIAQLTTIRPVHLLCERGYYKCMR